MMTFLAATSAAAEGEGIVFAFQNMVVGLGTVFLVLAFLIFVISSFKYVNELTDVKEALQQVRAAKKGTAPAAAQVPVKAAAPAAQPVPALPAGPGTMAAAPVNFADEVEGPVAAVIMAAVAEHLGGNFKVTSIKKSK